MTVIDNNTVMIVADTYELTIHELSEEVERLLKENHLFATQQDNRISAAPDMRTIRYYSTLGLLDRPLMQGRIAKYNRRHVLQLLAVKTLQGASLPLADIQEQLYGLSDHELESVIDIYVSENSESSASQTHKAPLRTVVWREIIIAPGLKLSADDTWGGATDQALLESKIRAALEILQSIALKVNGDNK
jgi:DNA-binding transcriptional MerR regulator